MPEYLLSTEGCKFIAIKKEIQNIFWGYTYKKRRLRKEQVTLIPTLAFS